MIRFIVTPRAAFADLLVKLRAARAQSSENVFLLLALSGLVADPPAVARAIWGAWLRNPSALVALLHLALTPIVTGLVFTGVAALILRFAVARGEFDLGQLFDLAAYANLPRVIVALIASAVWTRGGPLPALDSLADAPGVTLLWLALAWGGSLVWLVFAAQAMRGETHPATASPVYRRVSVAVFAAALTLVLAHTVWHRADYRPAGRGDRLGDIAVRELASGALQTFSFPRERKVVIDFWATWCPPCRAALPAWQKLQNEDADFVSLNLEPESRPDVQKFLRDNSYTFNVTLDAQNLQGQLQVDTLPTVIVVGSDGRIERFWVGGASESAIREALRPAILP